MQIKIEAKLFLANINLAPIENRIFGHFPSVLIHLNKDFFLNLTYGNEFIKLLSECWN